MTLTQDLIREHLDRVDSEGWNGAAGRELLERVRREVVLPLVRRSGLRGLAADQAEATGWEVAWQTLARPSTRLAENPGGVVWVAVRRGIHAEAAAQLSCSPSVSLVGQQGQAAADPMGGNPAGGRDRPPACSYVRAPAGEAARSEAVRSTASADSSRRQFEGGSTLAAGPSTATAPSTAGGVHAMVGRAAWAGRLLSLDAALAVGFEPVDGAGACAGSGLGPMLEVIADALVEHQWAADVVRDAIAILAENVRSGCGGGLTAPWRLVAIRLGIAEWRARRLAELLLGGEGWSGLVARIALEGEAVLRDPDVVDAMRSTGSRWARTPRALLAEPSRGGGPDPGAFKADAAARGQAVVSGWRTA